MDLLHLQQVLPQHAVLTLGDDGAPVLNAFYCDDLDFLRPLGLLDDIVVEDGPRWRLERADSAGVDSFGIRYETGDELAVDTVSTLKWFATRELYDGYELDADSGMLQPRDRRHYYLSVVSIGIDVTLWCEPPGHRGRLYFTEPHSKAKLGDALLKGSGRCEYHVVAAERFAPGGCLRRLA